MVLSKCYLHYHAMHVEREERRELTVVCQTLVYDRQCIVKVKHRRKDATNMFDCTTITDRLRTIGRSDNNHPTDVVIIRIKGQTSLFSNGYAFKWVKHFIEKKLHIETKNQQSSQAES